MYKYIQVRPCHSDLPQYDENWVGKTYKEYRKHIIDVLYQKNLYRKNLSSFREFIVPIDKDKNINNVKNLLNKMSDIFGINCIQISIDRKKQKVHLLCVNFHDELGKGKQESPSSQTAKEIILIAELSSELPKFSTSYEYKLFLCCKYKRDLQLFKDFKRVYASHALFFEALSTYFEEICNENKYLKY